MDSMACSDKNICIPALDRKSLPIPARNALVVSFAALVAYSFEVTGYQPFVLTGETAEGLPPVRTPPFSVTTANGTVSFTEMVQDMGTGLAVVPLMGLLESIAVAKAFASQNNYRIDANQELLAIGLTNVLGSLVSSYPVTGSFGRTAVNAQSGACTPAGGLVTGVLVLLSLDYLTSLFYYIPKSALAAVIIVAVAPLFDTKILGTLWRVKRLDLLPLGVTFLLCFWEVQYGILAGTLVSALMLLHSVARPTAQVTEGPVLILQPASGLHFPAAEALREALSRALEACPPRSAVLDCTHVCSVDYTVVLGLGELLEDFQKQGVGLAFVGLQVPVLRVLLSADLKGFQHFSTLEEAGWYCQDAGPPRAPRPKMLRGRGTPRPESARPWWGEPLSFCPRGRSQAWGGGPGPAARAVRGFTPQARQETAPGPRRVLKSAAALTAWRSEDPSGALLAAGARRGDPRVPSCRRAQPWGGCALLVLENLLFCAEKFLRQEPGTQPYDAGEDALPEHKIALLRA
ncbi:sodium-independent sulfate anion transporter isoform X2 [Dasypus novemcinctus]|uniref:sodium-independent sulfate anion transporter isoform X2 n=1 Tax=Dasypus novemcinctus TaxID=9361 RepID=UPI00265F24B8|nr:sodium-independent sulfate anion transporter isoform X2 [Dasypus novemcinctus]